VCVWDGLRPDSISPAVTPNLARIRDQLGVNFSDHHAVYPTFTMMNAAALATGAYSEKHGFFGNTVYQPGASGTKADGTPADYSQPIFTEDYGILRGLDALYRKNGSALLATQTLFQAAHAAGLRTAVLGKTGPAFLQDYALDGGATGSVVLDEHIAYPLSFAQELQRREFPLPLNSARFPFVEGSLSLAENNGDPTAPVESRTVLLQDRVTPDPRAALGSPHHERSAYMLRIFAEYVLPVLAPDLSLIWLRNPDSTEHAFGPGAPNHLDALREQDALFGALQRRLDQLGLTASTNLLVVSDHGHSSVAGDAELFPLRELRGSADGNAKVGDADPKGFSVSGEIRSADVLQRAGMRHLYDGTGCRFDPVLSGIDARGKPVHPIRVDHSGRTCAGGKPQAKPFEFTSGNFRVPEKLPEDAVVIAANGGSEYFYVLNQARSTVLTLVRNLQEQRAFGAIFVHSRYGGIPGTLPLSAIRAEAARPSPPTPDLIVSFGWNDTALAADRGLPGTEYASPSRNRGMHGSFSPMDVHNTLLAVGPAFKTGYVNANPSSNVDVAPTVAKLLGIPLPSADGRVLSEALVDSQVSYRVEAKELQSEPIKLSRTCQPSDPGCRRPGKAVSYQASVRTKLLFPSDREKPYEYLDQGKVTREDVSPQSK